MAVDLCLTALIVAKVSCLETKLSIVFLLPPGDGGAPHTYAGPRPPTDARRGRTIITPSHRRPIISPSHCLPIVTPPAYHHNVTSLGIITLSTNHHTVTPWAYHHTVSLNHTVILLSHHGHIITLPHRRPINTQKHQRPTLTPSQRWPILMPSQLRPIIKPSNGSAEQQPASFHSRWWVCWTGWGRQWPPPSSTWPVGQVGTN